MGKVRVNITIEENIVWKAKDLGLNISKISENALKDYIRRLESPNPSNNTTKGGIGTAGSDRVVARERFELSSTGPEPAMLDHYTTGLHYKKLNTTNKPNQMSQTSL